MTDAIIFMKCGSHAGHSMSKILADKKSDLAQFGWFLWGYNNNLCDPAKQVQPFAKEALPKHGSIHLVMSPTKSKFEGEGWPAQEFSQSGKDDWKPVPKGMHIFGSSKAIVCSSLVKCNETLSLDEYEVAVGQKGRRLSEHIIHHTDKACALRTGSTDPKTTSKIVPIILRCEVTDPFAVYLR